MAIARTSTFAGEPVAEGQGWLGELVTALRRNPLGVASAGIIVLLALTATFADVVAPYDPLAPHPEIRLSAQPRDHAKPELVVASALNPSCAR